MSAHTHLRQDEVYVDQVLDGPWAPHADAQLLPQPTPRPVSSHQVAPAQAVQCAAASCAVW